MNVGIGKVRKMRYQTVHDLVDRWVCNMLAITKIRDKHAEGIWSIRKGKS
jgi:hypothetical protein